MTTFPLPTGVTIELLTKSGDGRSFRGVVEDTIRIREVIEGEVSDLGTLMSSSIMNFVVSSLDKLIFNEYQ